ECPGTEALAGRWLWPPPAFRGVAGVLGKGAKTGRVRRLFRDLFDISRHTHFLPRGHLCPAATSPSRHRLDAPAALRPIGPRPRLRADGVDLPRVEPEGATDLRKHRRAASFGVVSLPLDS